MRCYVNECRNPRVEQCQYVDTSGARCLSSWCSDHGREVATLTYCPRHAPLAAAIAGHRMLEETRPDVDNRVPGLVLAVSRDLETAVMERLERIRVATPGATIDAIPLTDAGQPGVWIQGFTLSTPDGDVLRVTVEVSEQTFPEVTVIVNHHVVARKAPPWLERRLSLAWVPMTAEAAERARFSEELIEALDRAFAAVH